jgi:hypothetical protein
MSYVPGGIEEDHKDVRIVVVTEIKLGTPEYISEALPLAVASS